MTGTVHRPLELAHTSGAVVGSASYAAGGGVLTHVGVLPVVGFRGELTDPETGFVYLRARSYDPVTAQFLTPDPLYAVTGSRYGYAGGDPINGEDPTGLSWSNPCLGHTCASDAAKTVTNETISITTGGGANCVRGVTCSRDTPAALVGDQQAADFAGGVLNGLTGGLASDLAPGLYEKANVHSGFGWAGQGLGLGSSLVASAGDVWVARGFAGLSTAGTCLSGAPVGYCIAAGALNGLSVGLGSLPWGELGSPGAEALATVIGDYLGLWPGFLADMGRSGCGHR